jgi:hypothetical protein
VRLPAWAHALPLSAWTVRDVAVRIPAAKQQVRDAPDRDRQPERSDPVEERRGQRIADGDTRELQHRDEATLDEPKPARRRRDQRQHLDGAVREQDDRRAWLGAHGSERCEQRQVIEQRAARSGCNRLFPAAAEGRADEVAGSEQLLRQVLERVVPLDRSVEEPLERAPEELNGLVREEGESAGREEQCEQHGAERRGRGKAVGDGRTADDRGQGEDRQGQRGRKLQQRRGCERSGRLACIDAGSAEHRRRKCGCRRAAAGKHPADGVRSELCGGDGKPRLRVQRDPVELPDAHGGGDLTRDREDGERPVEV